MIVSVVVVAPNGTRRRRRGGVPSIAARAAARAPVNLLLQDDAVHAGLEQRKGHARLALEVAQAVEDVGRRVGREPVEQRGELVFSPQISQGSMTSPRLLQEEQKCMLRGNGEFILEVGLGDATP